MYIALFDIIVYRFVIFKFETGQIELVHDVLQEALSYFRLLCEVGNDSCVTVVLRFVRYGIIVKAETTVSYQL